MKRLLCGGQLSDAELIDQIEAIRARNNTHWMDLVRLAFRTAPVEARALMQQIQQCDGEVRRLSEVLAHHAD